MSLRNAKQPPITLIGWRQPETSNYACNFLLFGNRLIITGDMGESIHVWSDAITPEFVARTDYAYFASKAQGLDGHIRPYNWDPNRVRHRTKELIERWAGEEREFDLTGWDDQACSAFEWEAFVHEHEDLVHAGAYDWGRGLHYRSLGHWHGFKKAFDQLNGATPTAAQTGI